MKRSKAEIKEIISIVCSTLKINRQGLSERLGITYQSLQRYISTENLPDLAFENLNKLMEDPTFTAKPPSILHQVSTQELIQALSERGFNFQISEFKNTNTEDLKSQTINFDELIKRGFTVKISNNDV
jgi:DNA-binding Xre family transcriptional regulator